MRVPGAGRLDAEELRLILTGLGTFVDLRVAEDLERDALGAVTSWPARIGATRVPIDTATDFGVAVERGRLGTVPPDALNAFADGVALAGAAVWMVCAPASLPFGAEGNVVWGSADSIPFYTLPGTSAWFEGGGAVGWTHYRNGEATAGVSEDVAVYAAVRAEAIEQQLRVGGGTAMKAFAGRIEFFAVQSNVPTPSEIVQITRQIARYARVSP